VALETKCHNIRDNPYGRSNHRQEKYGTPQTQAARESAVNRTGETGHVARVACITRQATTEEGGACGAGTDNA